MYWAQAAFRKVDCRKSKVSGGSVKLLMPCFPHAAFSSEETLFNIGPKVSRNRKNNTSRHFPYSRDIVVFPVSRHFPYSRDFVVFPVSRHFPYSGRDMESVLKQEKLQNPL